jgi:hypothetical protein
MYRLDLVLTVSEPLPTPPPVYGTLRQAKGPATDNIVWWGHVGDNPRAGFVLAPTTGLIEPILDTVNGPHATYWQYSGWKVTGTGTIDVTLYVSTVHVTEGPVTITFSITKNGVAVAAEEVAFTSAGLLGHSIAQTVTITGLAVAPDDIIRATVTRAGRVYAFMIPAGAGQQNERLEITGGSLA